MLIKKKFLFLLILVLFIESFYLPCYSLEGKRPKIGLVLGGGGARGGAHVGVLKIFEKEKIPVDLIVGTSVGALIGALYAGGVSPDELEEYAIEGAYKKVYRTRVPVFRTIFLPINKLVYKITKKPFYAGLYNDHDLHRFVNDAILQSGDINIAVPLSIIAVDLVSGKPVVIMSGDVGLAVQASTAIPGLRQPVQFGDQLLIDGGVLNNLPIEEAKNLGADIIITISIDPWQEACVPQTDFNTFEKVLTRVINLSLIAQSENKLNHADVVIKPSVSDIGILDLGEENLKRAIKAGENAAYEVIPQIRKLINKNK